MAVIVYDIISTELMMELHKLFVVLHLAFLVRTVCRMCVFMHRELAMVALHPGHGVQTKSVEQRVHNRLQGDKTFLAFPVPSSCFRFPL